MSDIDPYHTETNYNVSRVHLFVYLYSFLGSFSSPISSYSGGVVGFTQTSAYHSWRTYSVVNRFGDLSHHYDVMRGKNE